MVKDAIRCLVSLIVSTLLTGFVCSIAILTPVPPVVVENERLDLNCFLTENTNTRSSSRFYVDEKGPVQVALLPNGSCVVIDEVNIAFNRSCENRNSFTITLGNVSRLLHGKTCRCEMFPSGDALRSNEVTINVSVPVGGVEIINVSKTSVSMAANNSTTLQCKTLPARPVATVKWTIEDTILSPHNTTTEQTTDDLTVITSVLYLFPDKTKNGKKLICSANNYMNISHHDWVTLNVTYPPDRPVTIEGLQNGQTVSIIENILISLNCTIGESNPPVSLNWSCTNATVFNMSDWNSTAKLLQIQASRNKQPVCSCTSTYSDDNPEKSEVSFDVLYPATISKLFSDGLNISTQQLNVIENDTVHVKCEADGNPSPTFRWTLQNEQYSYSQNITLDRVKRNNATTRYSCLASNVMNDSRGNNYQGNDTNYFTLIVLYPPRIHALHNLSIIEGNSTVVNCTINPGNPSVPTDIRWLNMPGKQSVLNFNKVNRTDSGIYTCVANNTMNTSYGDIRFGIDNKTIDLQVLYPPDNITIDSTTAPNHNVTDKISLIENTSLELICSAKGNPMPSFYSWSGLGTSDSPKVSVHTSKTNRGGNITCLAKNVMTELPQNNTLNGTIKKTVLVDVLYPPEIENITEIKVLERLEYNITCLKTSGKTTSLSFKWIRNNQEPSLSDNNSSLTIPNVSRNHAGQYGCFIQYEMKPTYGNSTIGNNNSSFAFNVLYPPELLNISFAVDTKEVLNITKSVTVIENASLLLNCSSLGNPLPSNYSWTGHNTNIYSAILQINVNRNSRGNFTCTAQNKMDLSNGTSVIGETSKTFEIDVQYPPELKEERYITIPEGKDLTLTCVRDYGRTVYSAVRWVHSNGTTIQGFDSLTLSNVTRSSSGNYTCETNYTMAPSYRDPITASMAITVYLEVTLELPFKTDSNVAVVGPAVGGALGVLLLVGALVSITVFCRKRRSGKRPDTPIYQNMKTKVINGENMSSLDGGRSNIYEKLQNTGSGSDQQYQQLSSFSREGQHKIYENLRLTNANRQQGAHVQNPSGSLNRESPNNKTQSIV